MTANAAEKENAVISPAADPEIEAMLEAGVHLGHGRSKRHPAMAPYVWAVRSNIEVIDLVKTKDKLEEALVFLRDSAKGDKLILFVGTRPAARDLIAQTAEELGCPYVSRRWIGGALTNFKFIAKRIETLENLEQEKAAGGFEKYTKKERLVKEAEIERLRQNFDGLRRMKKLPDVLVIIDIAHDDLPLREAKRCGIPVVALTDTNTDPRLVDYPIPSNDDARPAIAYMLGRMAEAVRQGRKEASAASEAALAAAPETASQAA